MNCKLRIKEATIEFEVSDYTSGDAGEGVSLKDRIIDGLIRAMEKATVSVVDESSSEFGHERFGGRGEER